MPCIIKKKKNGKVYYYAAESKRVNGRPRIVWQKYLGTIDTIVKKFDASDSFDVKETDIFEAGGVSAMLNIANKIGLENIIDGTVKKREQGPSVGRYMLLAVLNRIMNPCSKLQMSGWYKETILFRLWKESPNSFSSQHFWNNMDLINEKDIDTIQEKIAERVMNVYNINPSAILYDTTNFFTYIATGNKRNTVAQRGRSKQKRSDLRQVGLSLLVTKEFNIPLFHNVYEGNLTDQGDFQSKTKEIRRWKEKTLKKFDETTMVFDKGNVSESAIVHLVASGQHFVCGIPKTTCLEIFKTPLDEFKIVSELQGTKAYSGEIELWDKNFKFVLSYSESFFISQINSIMELLRKCETKLRNLDKSLLKWANKKNHKKKPDKKTVQKSINKILSCNYMKRLIKVSSEKINGIQRLSYDIDREELDKIMKEELGRTLLITTRKEMDNAEVIKEYRGLHVIENTFKNMKNKEFLHWQPAFHWTDQKIKVHGLYCVLALLLASLAHKTVKESGIEISLPKMLDELSKIREVALIYSIDSKKKSSLQISKMSAVQKKLAEVLEISSVLKG